MREKFEQDDDRAVIAAIARIGALDWRSEQPLPGALESAEGWGSYTGLPPQITLDDDGRTAHLITPISYTGPDGVLWVVPPNSILDGASIPRAFWTLIGGPFEGKYRNASIVHDRYCVDHLQTWQDTARMFHDAMRCSGVGTVKAKIMFYAVFRFGPRWPSPLEGNDGPFVPPETLSADTADSLALDAEAIFDHDLDLSEIEALVETRSIAASNAGLEGTEEAATTVAARELSIPGGQGTADDVAAIVPHAALLPDYILHRFKRKGVRFIACRGNVTDFESSLHGKVPRGWEKTGKTWDDVPGVFLPDKNRVVIATVDSDGVRIIPDRSFHTHGSIDLLVHESLHGYDFAGGHAVTNDHRFRDARTADLDRLDVYEKQDGDAGLQETFAESGAMFLATPADMAAHLPALHAYWAAGPITAEQDGELESATDPSGAIGTAELLPDGAIALDLRAEDDNGAVGHAQFRIAADDPAHAALAAHAFDAGLESARGTRVLLRP